MDDIINWFLFKFLDGAPATLVSLIGHKQYRRCARDLYYFLQVRPLCENIGFLLHVFC